MGGSYHALYPLYLQLVNCGRPALLVETSELLGSMAGILDPDTLLIAASQSGRSAETVRLACPHAPLRIARGRITASVSTARLPTVIRAAEK